MTRCSVRVVRIGWVIAAAVALLATWGSPASAQTVKHEWGGQAGPTSDSGAHLYETTAGGWVYGYQKNIANVCGNTQNFVYAWRSDLPDGAGDDGRIVVTGHPASMYDPGAPSTTYPGSVDLDLTESAQRDHWTGSVTARAMACGVPYEFGPFTTDMGCIVGKCPPPDQDNKPPIAATDHWTIRPGDVLTVPPPGVLANDSDPDGDPITARVLSISFASKEWSGLNPNGSFTYKAGPGTSKTLHKTITYVARDSKGAESAPVKAVVTIEVKCTIKGTPGNDTLVGGTDNDVICGFGGNDRLNGNGGHDLLLGGPGSDVLRPGDGNDRAEGNDGRDSFRGGNGNDVFIGGAGNDGMGGGPGDDSLHGGPGLDGILYIASASPVKVDLATGVATGEGKDTLSSIEAAHGSPFADTIRAGPGSELLEGGDANDVLEGRGGPDHLSGGKGDDDLRGGGDRDLLIGGPGQNELNGGSGRDFCYRGPVLQSCEVTK